uniref:Uncharacterized protein n=1 Tax=Thuretia quercifolia TaxID=189650 RepID=A0A1Z1MKU6_9FLOR|nr:hypothetical protein [Thuretia quercifolia]ARW66499.1 hypothetical protein [Thuretia quercifolia]
MYIIFYLYQKKYIKKINFVYRNIKNLINLLQKLKKD